MHRVTVITATKRKIQPPTVRELDSVAWKLRKQKCEASFHYFVSQAWPVIEQDTKFIDNWHLHAICTHLEAVSAGKIKRILFNVPPGTMKSLLVSVFWPAWEWATRPNKKFMFASYADSLSIRDSVRCRTLVESSWYQLRWHTVLRDDQNTKGKWENTRGGYRLATSVGGRGTGEHPDYKVFDDPHNVKEAESDAERQAVIDWWDGTMETRGAMHGAAAVGIMQRLHSKDLSAHLIEKGGWEHVCLPMRYEEPAEDPETKALVPRMKATSLGFQDPRTKDGELLWPSAYTEEKVASLESSLGLYHSAGQLQQRPSPRGGGEFERQWFLPMRKLPPVIRWIRYWDKAGTKGGTGAESSSTLMGTFEDPTETLEARRIKYIIADVFAFRKRASEREGVMKQTAFSDRETYGHVEIWVEQEPGSGGLESAENTVANLAGFSISIERVTGSKEVRAQPLSSQASVGKVYILAAEWNRRFLDEIESFPLGKLKDMVDSTSGAFNKLHVPTGAWTVYDVQRATTGFKLAPGEVNLDPCSDLVDATAD